MTMHLFRFPKLGAPARALRAISVTVLAALAMTFGSDAATAAPSGIPSRGIDIDVRGAPVRDMLTMLAQAGDQTMVIDPCVQGAVDLRLKNAPASIVFDAIAMKFGLTYEERDGSIKVHCAGDAGTDVGAVAGARVSLDVADAALQDVLATLAASAKLAGVDYHSKSTPKITMKLTGVRLATALAALSDSTGLGIQVRGGRLDVGD